MSVKRLAAGNALPLALMMTRVIMLAGMGLGLVVIEQNRRSIETDQAIYSYYMADAGIERQLYDVRKQNVTLTTYQNKSVNYPNGGTWLSTTGLVNVSSKTYASVVKDQFATVDLFDPDNVSVPSNVCKLEVSWVNDPNTCTNGANAQIEASYGYWTIDPVTGIPSWPTDNQFVVLTKSIQGNTSVYPGSTMVISGLQPTQAYRIRLRSYYCNALSVKVQAYAINSGTGQCDQTNFSFPGDITLSAQGSYGVSSQKITVTMPKLDVLSGVFSYVVFSECSIVKGTGTITCPP